MNFLTQNPSSCNPVIKKKKLTEFQKIGDPGGIQTLDLQNRNLTLYSAKLRGRFSGGKNTKISISKFVN